MKKQTAGRNALGEFAPKFAELNDDVLFGEVWSREDKLSLRDRSIVTITVLMTKGIFDFFDTANAYGVFTANGDTSHLHLGLTEDIIGR